MELEANRSWQEWGEKSNHGCHEFQGRRTVKCWWWNNGVDETSGMRSRLPPVGSWAGEGEKWFPSTVGSVSHRTSGESCGSGNWSSTEKKKEGEEVCARGNVSTSSEHGVRESPEFTKQVCWGAWVGGISINLMYTQGQLPRAIGELHGW